MLSTGVDQILAWEQSVDRERDIHFVDLGRYLCEVRSEQYWRLERLKSFDDILERRFPQSHRTAYYLMSIQEHLASDGKYLSLDEMRAAGDTGLPADSRGPSTYSIDAGSTTFTVTATYTGAPAEGVPQTLHVGPEMRISAE